MLLSLHLAIALLTLVSLAGFLGRLAYGFDQLAHFRLQYCIGAALLLIASLAARDPAGASIAVLVALVNGATLLPLYLRPRRAPRSQAVGAGLRFMTFNVLQDNLDARPVARAIAQAAPDLLLIQEIDQRWRADLASVLDAFPYRHEVVRADYYGIALYSRHPLAAETVLLPFDTPAILARVDLGPQTLTIVGVHTSAPHCARQYRERNAHLAAIGDLIQDLRAAQPAAPLLVAGDMNISPWSPFFHRLECHSGLRDGRRGFGPRVTWPAHYRARALMIPIDHCLLSPGLAVRSFQAGPRTSSDHLPLLLEIDGIALRPAAAPVRVAEDDSANRFTNPAINAKNIL